MQKSTSIVSRRDGNACSRRCKPTGKGGSLPRRDVGSNGEFHIDGVVPGAYKVFNWQGIESDATQNVEFLRQFESKATSLKLEENDRETVQLKLIAAEDVAKALGDRP